MIMEIKFTGILCLSFLHFLESQASLVEKKGGGDDYGGLKSGLRLR